MRFVNAEGIHTEGSRPAARRSLVSRRHIQPHAMIHADVLCDSSVALVANAVECERPKSAGLRGGLV